MSDSPRPSGRPHDPAPPSARTYEEVERLLEKQLEALRRGDLEAVQELGGRLDAILRVISTSEAPPDTGTRRRLVRLQDTLELALAQQRDEVSAKRARLRQGRTTLQAYRRDAER